MNLTDRINQANARSRRVPSVLLRLLLAWLLSAVVLGLLVPLLRAWGVTLEAWMAWAVILGSFALAVGPDVARRLRRRP